MHDIDTRLAERPHLRETAPTTDYSDRLLGNDIQQLSLRSDPLGQARPGALQRHQVQFDALRSLAKTLRRVTMTCQAFLLLECKE